MKPDSLTPMITATEARKKSESSETANTKAKLVSIERKINAAIKEGKTALTYVWIGNDHATMNALKALGYSVKNDYDQRDGEGWTTISW